MLLGLQQQSIEVTGKFLGLILCSVASLGGVLYFVVGMLVAPAHCLTDTPPEFVGFDIGSSNTLCFFSTSFAP
jgi:hypothetical protein